MIQIYNEEQHIKEVLEKGLNPDCWRKDLALLVKYFKSQNPRPKKSKIKEELIEKCVRYVPDFDKIQDAPKTKAYIDKVWREWKVDGDNPSTLRIINHIDITKEELDWFLNLSESFTIDNDLKLSIQEKRFPAKIGNHPMTFTRVKFLFTLFIWTKIQNEYMGYGIYHDLDSCKAKLRKDADLPASFNILNERNILEDLGFVKTTDKNVDTLAIFFEKEPVFQTVLTEKNKVTLTEEDLYNCRKWLEKKKFGTFICKNCGKEIIKKSKNNKRGRPNLYCKECSQKLNTGRTFNTKKEKIESICEICGIEIGMVSKYSPHKICSSCQDKKRALVQKRYRESHKKDETSSKNHCP